MPPRLIVNADDLGLTPGINRVVGELYRAGAVTSATLMATGPAFDDAVAMAKRHPGLGIGCHIVFTGGVPVSQPRSLPSLIGADGRSFRTSANDFFLAVLRGGVQEEHIAHEALAQIQKLQQAGLDVTHVDTHKHTHILPKVARALLLAMERTGIKAIRNPFEEPWSRSIGRGGLMRNLEVALIQRLKPRFFGLPAVREGRVLTTDGTLGISATGRLDTSTLRQLIDAMPDGVWELVCHPGANDADLAALKTRLREHREIERGALLQVLAGKMREALRNPQPGCPALIHYGSLAAPDSMRGQTEDHPQTP